MKLSRQEIEAKIAHYERERDAYIRNTSSLSVGYLRGVQEDIRALVNLLGMLCEEEVPVTELRVGS